MGLFNRKKKEAKQESDVLPIKTIEDPEIIKWKVEAEEPMQFGEPGDMLIIPERWYPDVEVAGVQYREIPFSKLNSGDVKYILEPENEYDPKAIKIEQNGIHIGYIPANLLQKMAHDFLEKRNTNMLAGNIVEVDSENNRIVVTLEFRSVYFTSDSDYPY